jgi:uncharacterized membrane protein HdeD (DUF308 family)
MNNPMFFDSVRNRFWTSIRELDEKRFWVFGLGILLVVLGVIAIYLDIATTILTVVTLGAVLLAASIVLVVFSVLARAWSGVLLTLAVAALSAIAGFTMLSNPLASAAALTLVIGTIFIVAGVYRSIASIVMRFPNWGWSLVNGLIALTLGVLLVKGGPTATLWFLGLFVGIELIFQGMSWIMFASGVHRIAGLEPSGEERRAA